ncbi:hypothetical protein [Bizionia sp.]|uniref:hypothetical protein n=1 Tax=Bizionia sp. TaxID=1954480 RepID=UPI003A8CC0EE
MTITEYAEIWRTSHRQKYNAKGIEYLQSNMVRHLEKGEPIDKNTLLTHGGYFGQCLIEIYGGSWNEDETGLYIILEGTSAKIYPIQIVQEYYENGDKYSVEHSVGPMFRGIPAQFNIQPKPKKKSWWQF